MATVEALADSSEAAVELAGFLTALQRFAPGEIPARGTRGDLTAGPLVARDRATRTAIAEVDGVFDAAAMTDLWEAAISAPGRDGPAVWFHGDFHTGNLLTVDGRLSAVIDFGGLGIGDPACDLVIAFTLLSAGSRAAFRAALGTDDATWIRGHGWALATAPNACTYCAAVNPRVAAQTTRQITEALIGQVSGAKAYHSTGCAGRVPGGALDGLAGHRGKGLFKRFAGVMSDSAWPGRRRPGCSARRGGAGSGRRAVPVRRQPGCPPGSRAQRWWAPSCAGAVRRRGPDA